MKRPRRLVISVCPREAGEVVLPVERGGRRRRLDAAGVAQSLLALVAKRGLGERVRVQDACVGGCAGPGPNVSVILYAMPGPGEKPDNVAVGWKTYVYSLPSLDCLATLIDENLQASG